MEAVDSERRARISSKLAAANPSLHHHLFGTQPKRILALDGGGVLGIIEIAFLERIEALLRTRFRRPGLVLSDYFDLVGGTSTGAIIATGLALGMTAGQLKNLYFALAADVFRRPLLSLPGVGARFDARILSNKLRAILGDRPLESQDLLTGLALVAKRVDTGSPWVLTNNPMSKYWDDPPVHPATGAPDYLGNRHYLLRDLVRSSTAAPYYYSPKRMRIVEGEPQGLFVDGGLSPHNNPALQMLMLASIRGYGFQWPVSADQLSIISIGCGWMRPRIRMTSFVDQLSAALAIKTLRSLIWDSQVNTLKLLQWMSNPRLPWPINSEVGTLRAEVLGSTSGTHQELLQFQRYDVMLEPNHDDQEKFGPTISAQQRARLDDFMNPAIMDEAYALGCQCAAIQVDGADFSDNLEGGPSIATIVQADRER